MDHNAPVTTDDPLLTPARRALLAETRRAVLVTLGSSRRLRPVPVCFAVSPPPADVVWTPIDEKPKRSEGAGGLARVRDILSNPTVAVLADRWDEDWSRLAWLRLEGEATLLEPPRETGASGENEREHARAVVALRARYPQYASHALERLPVIRIAVTRAVEWEAAGDASGSAAGATPTRSDGGGLGERDDGR